MDQKKEVEVVRNSLDIYPVADRMYVYLFVFNTSDLTQNKTRQIKARRGTAIGGYPYDVKSDCYHIECLESFELGFVDVAYRIALPNVGPWTIPIPVPFEIIKNKLDQNQKQNFDVFEKKYSDKKYELSFAQLLSCDH